MANTTYKFLGELHKSVDTALVDKAIPSSSVLRPQFLSNDYKGGRKVLSAIEDELATCDEFCISVAFITMGGIAPLLQTLKELEIRGVCGKILTTDYLTFSDPKALKKLAELSNIELRMFCSDEAEEGFHTKGYIFRNDETYRLIIGSSNMTLSALTKNKEWNTRIVSTDKGEFADDVLKEFQSLWNSPHTYSYAEIIEAYKTKFEIVKKQKAIAAQSPIVSLEQYKLQPNSMQVGFIRNLRHIREQGKDRALLISATGTGKTYASAFALRDQAPKKALFLVHRELIAKQAIKSYKRVFGKTKSFGLLSGNAKECNVDYLFATMQTMSKPETLSQFKKDEFDTIIIDEVHRAGAESYQRIMNYFTPRFWLGMTASPERTDGYDIYGLFDHNIAYEIRLQQALEENMLCPFHYFGISDLEINGEVFDDTSGLRNFNRLVSDDRVDHIITQLNYYGYSGDRVKGLVFCSRKAEAMELSAKFNQRGYHTVCLSGEDSPQRREACIERLTADNSPDQLDYIFTVDIFNEGVDIPEINQVIMLRPTQSPIVFVQQLGRGLRKAEGKEFVIVIDFIGNYQNNYMIPIALSGDRTGNKDNIRRGLMEGSNLIQGASTIYFDEITRKRIYDSIDCAKTDATRALKTAYDNLRNKLGRIPSLCDYDKHGEIDPLLFINKYKSYHNFLKVVKEKDYNATFTESQVELLNFISTKFAAGKRPHELLLLQNLLNGLTFKDWKESIALIDTITEASESCVINQMSGNFYPKSPCVLNIDTLEPSDTFKEALADNHFKDAIAEVINFGLSRYKSSYHAHESDSSLCVNHKYTYSEVCQLLNYDRDLTSVMMGYWHDKKTNTFSVFINYEKTPETTTETTYYHDRFGSCSNPDDKNHFVAISKSRQTTKSKQIRAIANFPKTGTTIRLFVRKNKNDITSKEFYYLGKVEPTGKMMDGFIKGTQTPIVEIEYKFLKPVNDRIYEYITEKTL